MKTIRIGPVEIIVYHDKPLEANATMTAEEFERWLGLQQSCGWTVTNPEAVEKIRAAFRASATCSPMREGQP